MLFQIGIMCSFIFSLKSFSFVIYLYALFLWVCPPGVQKSEIDGIWKISGTQFGTGESNSRAEISVREWFREDMVRHFFDFQDYGPPFFLRTFVHLTGYPQFVFSVLHHVVCS